MCNMQERVTQTINGLLIINKLSQRSSVLLEKQLVAQLLKNFPTFLEPMVPIRSQINPVHTTPSYIRSILILPSRLRLRLPSGLLPSGFPIKIPNTLSFSPTCTTCPVSLIPTCVNRNITWKMIQTQTLKCVIYNKIYYLRGTSISRRQQFNRPTRWQNRDEHTHCEA
jgi:hypothetical protein